MLDEPVPHPGILLKERFLDPLGITPYRLAKAIGVHVRRVSELCRGRRPITPDTAARLSLFFDCPARWFLEAQARWEAQHLEGMEALREVVRPLEGRQGVLVTPGGARPLRPRSVPATASLMAVSPALRQSLARVTARSPEGPRRVMRVVDHGNGAVALTGEAP